jgi:hypothetical protein
LMASRGVRSAELAERPAPGLIRDLGSAHHRRVEMEFEAALLVCR